MGKMVDMVKEGEAMKENRVEVGTGAGILDKNPDKVLPFDQAANTQPGADGNLKEVELPIKQMMEVVAKTLAKEVVPTEENHSGMEMSEKQAEVLMVKALTKAQINFKTEELEKAKVSP